MSLAQKARPAFSIILAVSTAIAVMVPPRTCACAVNGQGSVPCRPRPVIETVSAEPEVECMHRCCCPVGTRKADCCCRNKAPISTDVSLKRSAPSCPCVRCDCDDSDKAPIAPPSGGHSIASHLFPDADTGMSPPLFLLRPAASKALSSRVFDPRPSADLITLQSRLTC